MKVSRILIWALVLSLPLVGLVLAGGGVARPRQVVGSGAVTASAAGGVTMRGTLGQPLVGSVSTAGGFSVGQGFWHGGVMPAAVEDRLYLPLAFKEQTFAPDLVVDRLVATSNVATVTVRNAGNASVEDAFWVDVYFDPTETPTVNKPWNTIAGNGAVWGVTTPISAGGVLTLTVGGTYYFPQYSGVMPFPVGASVYALADSVDFSTSYGAVRESDESNNLFGPVESGPGSGEGMSPAGGTIAPTEALPKRER